MKFRAQLLVFPLVLALTACFAFREKKPENSGEASVELHKQGILIEARYNSDLDNLIPGYKIINVGLTNNGVDILKLDPLRDRWEIIDAYGQPQRAINSLRIKDPAIWSRLPQSVKTLIEYPVGVSVGYSETIDLFFPNDLDLTAFRSIIFYNAERKEKYDALANLEGAEAGQASQESGLEEALSNSTPRKKKK